MSNSLNSIMLKLKNSIDSIQNVTDVCAVQEAIRRLESFPMTMGQLQDTRIGQLLQSIRHRVDPSLQKRIRFIIKAWQKLLSSDFSHPFVIPVNLPDKNTITYKPNGTSKSLNCEIVNSSMETTMNNSTRHNSLDVQSYADSNPNIPAKMKNQLQQSSPRRLRIVNSQSSLTTSTSNLRHNNSLVNGNKPNELQSFHDTKPHSSTLRNSTSFTTRSPSSQPTPKTTTPSVRLSKVKSTAELVEAAGDCIDSVTADRILTNRINKEIDPSRPSPSQSTKPRQSRVCSTRSVAGLTLDETKPTSSVLECKSEKYRAVDNVALQREERIPSPTLSCSPDAKSQSLVEPFKSSTNIVDRLKRHKLDKSDHFSNVHKTKKKRKRHKHRLQSADDSSSVRSVRTDRQSKYCVPPITNHLDDWPNLPPIPAHIDWNNLDHDVALLCDNILPYSNDHSHSSDTFPPDSSVLGQPSHVLTDLHSITLDDQYLHILPWVDMVGYKRHFFPVMEGDVDRLTNLPEPW